MKPGTDPDTRLVHIIGKLKELDPDIIGIQEINETLTDTSTNQAKVISDSLSKHFGIEYYYYYSFTHLSWNNTFREFVGIVSKYPFVDTGYKQLPPGLFIRKAVWGYIDSPLGMINFFSTHLSFTNVEARINQVEEIIPYVAETTQNYPGIAAILLGDFNDVPNSEPIVMLTGTASGDYFIDTFLKIHPFGNPGYTVDSDNPERRIDYIFIKNDNQLTIDDSYTVMDEPYSGNLYCSDHLGVMTIFKASPTDLNEPEHSIEGFEMYQNYPNPCNPVTTIKYSIPVSSKKYVVGSNQKTDNGIQNSMDRIKNQAFNQPISQSSSAELFNVQLKIYDLLGKEVAILVNEKQRPGEYEVEWYASDFPSGVYFYTLTAGQFRFTKKMVVMK